VGGTAVDIETVLTRIEALVTDARGVPMSTSCLVSRDDVLDLIEDARDSLPGQLADAQRVLSQRDTVIAEAREQAQAIIENAQREQQHLVAQEEVVRRAHEEAERILTEATVEAQRRGDGLLRSGPSNHRERPTRTAAPGCPRRSCPSRP